jgi:hypothetical protein
MRLSAILLIIISVPFSDSYIKKNRYNNYLTKKCNNFALEKTKFQDVYDCLTKTNKCNHLENYNEFNKYRIECFRNVLSNKPSIDVIIYLVIWIIVTLLF